MSLARLTAPDEAAALEALHDADRTDGLPVVVPTPERVETMLAGAAAAPDDSLGEMGPAGRPATVEAVAVNAVMAGCLPEHLPVVLAAVRALLAPEFDLTEVQSTTHNLAPLVIVNGPVRARAGLTGGTGALGPGHRANASIGRAVRLVLLNVGGARPGISDMALLGHPGKFTFCLAEDEERSPFGPLAASRGVDEGASAVTVVGAEAPHSVLSLPKPGTTGAEQADALLRVLALALASPASNPIYAGRGSLTVLLNVDHARLLAGAGHDRASVQAALHERARQPRSLLRELAGDAVPDGPPDDRMPAVASPDDIVVAVAGDGGLYSAVLPGWGGGPHGNRAVTVAL